MPPIRERIANRTLHREQLPIHGREVAGLLALASLIALPIVFGLFQDSEYVRASFAIESLRAEKLALQERYRRLRIERATLESLDRIAWEARKSGLVPPEEASGPVIGPGSSGPRPAGTEPAVAAVPPSAPIVARRAPLAPAPLGAESLVARRADP